MNAENTGSFLNAVVPAELHDIRGPVSIAGEWLWLWVLAAVVAVLALIFILSRFRRNKEEEVLMPVKPAWEKALEAMADLERGGCAARGLVKEFYSQLSGIVRVYIEERFDIRAPEMTTEEFMAAVSRSDKLTLAQHGFLRDFLGSSDMVKFAKAVPVPADMTCVLQLARAFVEETR